MRPSERVMERSEKLKDAVRREYFHALSKWGRMAGCEAVLEAMDRKELLLLAGGSQEALRWAGEAVLAEAGLDGSLDVPTASTTD